MSNDGTGLREALQRLLDAYDSSANEFEAAAAAEQARAALSAVAPPPVLEGDDAAIATVLKHMDYVGELSSAGVFLIEGDAQFQAVRRRLRAASPAAPAQQAVTDGWQPIETAPKNNKRLLYFARFNHDGELVELDFDGIWQSESESWELPNVYSYWASSGGIEEPTHWAYQDAPIPPALAPNAAGDTPADMQGDSK